MVTSRGLFLAFLGLLVLERAVELAVSARHERSLRARGATEAGRGHFPAMVALHATFVPACAAEVLALHRPFPGIWALLPLAGVVAALGLRWSAMRALGERWTVRVFVLPGTAPVRRGPYRFLRHPNYVAVALEIACVPLLHGAWLCAAAYSLANAALLSVRIAAEERALGPVWKSHFAGVPRFVPRASR